MEVTATALPDPWAVFCGLSDVIALLQGMPVTVVHSRKGRFFTRTNPC
jgi:nicotinate phosphoribosyltransferase